MARWVLREERATQVLWVLSDDRVLTAQTGTTALGPQVQPGQPGQRVQQAHRVSREFQDLTSTAKTAMMDGQVTLVLRDRRALRARPEHKAQQCRASTVQKETRARPVLSLVHLVHLDHKVLRDHRACGQRPRVKRERLAHQGQRVQPDLQDRRVQRAQAAAREHR